MTGRFLTINATRSKPAVSIFLPTFNSRRYIRGAIESVLGQTYPNFELIVVDDGSEDSTLEIISAFNDPRIFLVRHLKNLGISAARNTALSVARGEWFALLDSDDRWTPGRLERLLQIAREAGEDYFIADDLLLSFETSGGLQAWGRNFKINYKILIEKEKCLDFCLEDFLAAGSPEIHPIIPLATVRKFDLQYNVSCLYGEDLEFFCHLFRCGLKLKLYAEPLYIKNLSPDSVTSKKDDKYLHLAGVYERLFASEGFTGKERELFLKLSEKMRAEHRYNLFAGALKRKMWGNALKYALKDPGRLVEFIYRSPRAFRYRLAARRRKGRTF
jgi:glycosyltransferase involved in cell wall biosynthesis